MNWKPILKETKQETARRKINEIAEILTSTDTHNPYLMHGDLGSVLFLFYYCFWSEDENLYETAARQFAACVEKIQKPLLEINSPMTCKSTLENGLSGIGWGINHLLSHEMIEGDISETMGTADAWLCRRMIYDIQQNRYALLQGATGTALYCLNRPERFASEYLSRFILELHRQIRQNDPGQIHDFSIPTGLAGLFLLIRKIRQKRPDMEYLPEISERLASILKKQTVTIPRTPFALPGWNQSETGILWSHLQIPETRDQALEQWNDYGKLQMEKNGASFEAGLFGGNFSLGHLFNRVYQLSGDPTFREFACRFIETGLEQASFPEEKTAYKVWLTGIDGTYGLHRGLLGGLSGIGLTLLAAISDEEPDWDESLLLS